MRSCFAATVSRWRIGDATLAGVFVELQLGTVRWIGLSVGFALDCFHGLVWVLVQRQQTRVLSYF